MQRSANSLDTLVRILNDSRMFRAIIGMYTLSSNAPLPPPHATAASFPITCAATCVTASGITGLTLPGMIELPG